MAAITVKNIPDDLYARLKQVAHLNHRSINSEIIVCIERALINQRMSTEEILARARELRAYTEKTPIKEEEITAAKRDGRP